MPGSRWLRTSEKELFFSLSPTIDREPGTVISLNFFSPDHVILEDRQSFATNLMRASPTQIDTWLFVNKLSAAGSFRECWMQMNCIVLPLYLVLFILRKSILLCFERGTVLDSWFTRLFWSFSLTAVNLSLIGYWKQFSCQKSPWELRYLLLTTVRYRKKNPHWQLKYVSYKILK